MSRAGVVNVTRIFRGLPSPAAAGVLGSLVLLRGEYAVHDAIEWSVLVALPLLGLLMVSRMPFTHVMNRYFDARRAHPVHVVFLVLLVYLVVAHFVETVTALFVLYALSGPLLTATHRVLGWPAWVEHEEEDEETLVAVPDEEEETGTTPPDAGRVQES
jgi:phosphatidylserine synthase